MTRDKGEEGDPDPKLHGSRVSVIVINRNRNGGEERLTDSIFDVVWQGANGELDMRNVTGERGRLWRHHFGNCMHESAN